MNKLIYYEEFAGKNRNEYRVMIDAIDDWDGFKKIAEYLISYHAAELVQAADGPDARRWIFLINGVQIELIHSDWIGNYLCSPDQNGKEIMNLIGKALEEKLNNIKDINDF